MYRKIHLRTNPYLIKDGKYYPETRDDIHFNFAKDECWGCRISKYFLLGGSPALCPNGGEIGHIFDAILYKRSSFPGIPFGMPYFRLFCFQLSKSMPFLMEKDNFPFFRSESCNEAY